MENQKVVFVAIPSKGTVEDGALTPSFISFIAHLTLQNPNITYLVPMIQDYQLLKYMPDVPATWEKWGAHCRTLIGRSDEVLVLQYDGWDTSDGVAGEIAHAKACKKPIVFQVPTTMVPTNVVPKDIKPIQPNDIATLKSKSIPGVVIWAANELLVAGWRSGSENILIRLDDLIKKIMLHSDYTREQLFNNGWLDIENVFREEGWVVTFTAPGHDDHFDSYFIFAAYPGTLS